jgi:hydrogenase expression/formation protein HypE
LRAAQIPVLAMRDATRGGLAAVLHEWAESSARTLAIDEVRVPVSAEVRGVCELLGLDPVHVANEGTMVVAVRGGSADEALDVLHRVEETAQATCIGAVRERTVAPVVIRRALGQELALDEPMGAPLPRIC